MSVGIQGGGGGKIIKDATAFPSDVSYGKIAYNNTGKIVGTHKEKFLEMEISFKSGETYNLTNLGRYSWDLGKKVGGFRIYGGGSAPLVWYQPVVKDNPYVYFRYMHSYSLEGKKFVGVRYNGDDIIIDNYDDILFELSYNMTGYGGGTNWSADLGIGSINGNLYIGFYYFCEGEFAKMESLTLKEDINLKLYFKEN